MWARRTGEDARTGQEVAVREVAAMAWTGRSQETGLLTAGILAVMARETGREQAAVEQGAGIQEKRRTAGAIQTG